MKQIYRLTDEKGDKFWMIDYSDNDLMVNYGKIGTIGRFQVKEFAGVEECEKYAKRQIASKIKKGYKLWEDFDFGSHLYFDDEGEIGLHAKTSHPRFREHFTEAFYYDCSDEEAPFGNDDGNDTLSFLYEYMRKHRETDLVDFPRNLQENEWGLEWFEPKEPVEEEIQAILSREKDGNVPLHRCLLSCDRVIAAAAFGQIKVMGKVFERLRHMALCSLKRMVMADRLLGYKESYTIPQMIKDLESFQNPSYRPTEEAQTIMEYLGCSCEVFGPAIDDDDIFFAYETTRREGVEQGYTPLLVIASNTLLEAITLAADDDSDMDFEQKKVMNYRKEIIQAVSKIDAMHVLRSEEKFSAELVGKVNIGKGEVEVVTRCKGHWDFSSHFAKTGPLSQCCYTHEVILAKLPVKNPWEAAIYIPMGGFNDCPEPKEQAAVMKYWYEKHGAIPAMVSYDTWEFTAPPLISLTEENFKKLPEVEMEKLMALAAEQYAFCADRIDQCKEGYSLGDLASSLAVSTKWYFWWD